VVVLLGDTNQQTDPVALKNAGVKALGVYCGPDRPPVSYLQSLILNGIGIWFIQESTATSPWAGYDEGVAQARYAEQRVNEVGYPSDCIIYYNLSDTPNISGHEQAITAFAKGVADASLRPQFGGYGGQPALDAGQSGNPKLTHRWKVQTWGTDSPADIMRQMPNEPAPVPGVDADWLVGNDIGTIGAWGVANNVAGDNAYMTKKSDPSVGVWVTNGVEKRHVLPDEWSFVNFVTGGQAQAQVLQVSDQWWDSIPVVGSGGTVTIPTNLSGTFSGKLM
jgi:hypothetical protein